MPPLYALDDYEGCMLDDDAVYCVVDVDLFSRRNSSLMKFIQGYSEYKMKHYNHTQLHRGVCVQKSCNDFIKDKQNITVGREVALERCLNESIWRSYEIEAKLGKVLYCKTKEDKLSYDVSDYVVAVIYLSLILLNIIGTSYDLMFCQKDKESGNPFLMAFSVNNNWSKLVAPSGVGSEPRLERLKLFHGLRAMTMICVIFSHTVLIMAFSYVDNPLFVEKSYEDPLKQILFNGSLVTHTFFVMSSFLLAYNFQLHAEKHEVTWLLFPKGIVMRWIRLTPTYALILATICTWMRHLGDGPLWQMVVTSEADACRQYWWAHVFYINNYLYNDAYCAPQTWYLAADTQLFCVGLFVCVFVRSSRARKIVLSVLIVISLVIPALHTYFQNLDAVVIQSPESSYRELYVRDDTFRLLYIRGHTNLSTFVLGLIGGFLAFHWQTEGKDFNKYKKYNWCVWLLFPAGVLVILSGGLFYIDGSKPSDFFRIIYATFYKPIFQTLVVCLIISIIFKVETVYRGIIEWRGFTWMGRVSYSAFLCHTMFQRGLIGAQTIPTHMSEYYVVVVLLATVFMSYVCGGLLWLLVEAPLGGVTKAVMGGNGKRQSDVENK
ncbi:nose resistant to fluoxetine protein 6-like [Epargyreus clarus]|uniref:nose resistant to fluoxetine protein 6-like n=1 Tax=Epargyreus clarus TaxID=520877 RepID=UPI003C300860